MMPVFSSNSNLSDVAIRSARSVRNSHSPLVNSMVKQLFSIVFLITLISICSDCFAQDVVLESQHNITGKISSLAPGMIKIEDDKGEVLTLKYQGPSENAISLGGAKTVVRFPANIQMAGKFKPKDLSIGQVLSFKAKLARGGKVESPPTDYSLILGKVETPRIVYEGTPQANVFEEVAVFGEVVEVRDDKLILATGKSPLAANGRLALGTNDNVVISVQTNDLQYANVGDKVTAASYAKFSTGDAAISAIDVEMLTLQKSTNVEDSLEAKFRSLSDEPSKPRDVRSEHFVLHTDVSDRNAQILLAKLERMIELVSIYFQRPPRGVIECYVVRDLEQWPRETFEPAGYAKIASKEGVTISRSLGRNTQSIVYSCDKHGVVQHEAMHAYCSQTFGSTGPTWYAEGVAELGQYWKAGELAVNIDPVVADYLAQSEPKKMLDIVAAGQVTGDSWQAYAWRWALCYLLANNPNYNGQFKQLGVAMMSGKPDTFESAYGAVAQQISFEYDLFVKHVHNGYRADLCAWQWNKKFTALKGSKKLTSKINAQAGWQPTGATVETGVSYQLTSKGTWKITGDGEELTVAGDSAGKGKLVGVIFQDFALSEEFDIGDGAFTPPSSGQLYVRCKDDWSSISDNDGTISVTFSVAD